MTGEQLVVTVLLVVAMLVSLMRGLKEPVEEEECEEAEAGGGFLSQWEDESQFGTRVVRVKRTSPRCLPWKQFPPRGAGGLALQLVRGT